MSAPYKTVEEALAALGPLPDGYESSHGPLWSLLDWSLWGAGMGDVFREALADRMVAAIPADGVVHAEALMAEFIRRRQIEKTGVTIYQEQRDEVERLRGRVAELEAQASDTRAEVLAEVTTWLVKKAREFRAAGETVQADTAAVLASKVERGAVRPDNLRMLPADFFEPGHSYTHRDGSTFRCVAVTTHPDGGERVALGWHTDTADWTFVGVRNINHWNHEYDGVRPPTEGGESR